MKKALIIVDEQNDFCEGGALGVEGGRAAVTATTEYLNRDDTIYDLIVATRDWHDPTNDNGDHFADEPDFVDTWPAHCVQGTEGAEYAPELDTDFIDVHIVKGMGRPDYSGFQGVAMNDDRTLEEVLKNADINQIDIVGIATDHCVRATALDGKNLGFDVRVLMNLTAAVDPDNDVANEMANVNVEVVEV